MKFVNVADVHFDIPFRKISDRAGLGRERRIDQRKAFKRVIEFVKENNVDYLFIAGDLYEHEYIQESTIEYINNLFKTIKDTKIYITPGNHDPKIKNSYYETYKFADNVKIFTNRLEIVENSDCDIYGYGFNNFEMTENSLDNLQIKNLDKINVFISHGDIYNKSIYNPMDIKLLESKFDVINLGHIHKRDDYYPGSLISLGFDEPGMHGFIYGEIGADKHLRKEFIAVDDKQFVKEEFDISNILSNEELIEQLNSFENKNFLYEIELIGERKFKIEIELGLLPKNVIKIKDKTALPKEESEINENSLYGIFIKNLKTKLENNEITSKEYDDILELEKQVMNK